jgi:hypothetical protein
MGQVPQMNFHYLIVGNGRTSRNIQKYFLKLGLPFSTFSRALDPPGMWNERLKHSTHVLLLLKDDQVGAFYEMHPELHSKQCVHFSGAGVHPQIPSAHPLMTFTETALDMHFLEEMVFTIEAEGPPFQDLLPGVPNTHVKIRRAEKARYHAWCVMSGNFTTLLWEATAEEFRNGLGLNPAMLKPYLQAITANLAAHLSINLEMNATDSQIASQLASQLNSQLSGPFVRRDLETIQTHLAVLDGHPFHKVYDAFWSAYQNRQGINP